MAKILQVFRFMIIYVVIIVAVLSVLMSLLSLKKQNQLGEVAKAKKDLQRKKVIYHKDSSK